MSRRGVVVGVVVVLVLAGGAVAVDALARDRVEQRIATEVAAGFELGEVPDVEISGTTFLPQVLGGSVSHVRVSADAATIGDLPMEDVVVSLEGVSAREPYVADVVDFSGLVPLEAAQATLPDELVLRIDGGAVHVSASVLGLPLEVAATPVADGRAVVARVDSLTLAGVTVQVSELPPAVAAAIEEIRVPVDGLPEGMILTAVEATPAGLQVTATGTEISLTR